jgi:histidyl-tRNA synthetase
LVNVRAVKGTKDILPDESSAWQRVEAAARDIFARYGYRELRTPVFEETQLFARGIGAETDIVSKEMYTFEDRDGASLTLRPEATAGIVRSVIEHNLINTDPALKVYAMGPMFRRERPQKGRYRQFHQVDVEALGYSSPSVDAEAIEMALGFLEACGLPRVELILNSVGDDACRPSYVETLRAALRKNLAKLGPDSQRRTETNPLRVLDSKTPEEQELIATLPKIGDHLCGPCRDHFDEVKRQLDLLGIRYRLEPRLVRGLDYYKKTTFEVVSGDLGAQNSVLGGGRYDGLVRDLGGPDVPGVGWALGLERLVLLLPEARAESRCEVFIAPLVADAVHGALRLQQALRREGIRVLMDPEGRSFKSRMKLADKLGASFVAIRGEDELARGVWSVRDMADSSQEEVKEVALVEVVEHLETKVRKVREKANG